MSKLHIASLVLVSLWLLPGCPGGEMDVDGGVDAGTGNADGGRDGGGAADGGGGMEDGGSGDAGRDAAAPSDAATDGASCAPTETPESCRSDGDCRAAFEQCLAPGEFGGCGICMEPMALCTMDTDCDDGSVCIFYRPLCSCGGDASECRPRCTASSCEPGDSCDETSGRCGPTSCTAGYVCPEHTACDPSSERADPHGCERRGCTADRDCDCGGACVDGGCYDALGTCSALPA